MSDTSKLAQVLREYEVFRKGPAKKGGGDFHKGLIHLRNVDQDRVAHRVLQRDWHNRKAVASMFKLSGPPTDVGGIVGEVICVLIEIAPVSNVQATVKSLPNTL